MTSSLSPMRRKRRLIIYAILALGTILICVIGISATSAKLEKNYKRVLDDPSQIALDILDYKDAFDLWNSNACGNDINTLLAGGSVYSRAGISVLPSTTKQNRYAISKDGSVIWQISTQISSINVWGDKVYYRDDAKQQLCVLDIVSRKSSILVSENVGSFIVTSEKIYFTDLSKNSSLYWISIDGDGKPVLLLDGPIDQFAVLGDTILFRGYDNVLYALTIGNSSIQSLGKSVERFFLDGSGLILESGNTIYRTKPDGTKPEKVFVSDEDDFNLVGVYSGNIIIQRSGLLYQLIENGVPKALLSTSHTNYGSFVVNSGKLYAVAINDGVSKKASFELVELPFAELEAYDG